MYSAKEALMVHFDNLKLPTNASVWLTDLWDCIQAFDDWYDNEQIEGIDKEVAVYKALVLLPSNPFYLEYAHYLAPILSNAILKWSAANKKESKHKADAKAYMWRASYYDVILEVVRIIHGPRKALEISDYVADMYGEKYEEYLKEFENA